MSVLEDTKPPIASQGFFPLVNVSYHKTGFSVQLFQGALQFTNELDRGPEREPCYWTRGDVEEFSHESRKRLLRKFACLQTFNLHKATFVTLTYHHGHESDTRKAIKDFMTFLQYLRDTTPGVNYIWRLEMQKRGAPHFHLILFFPAALKNIELGPLSRRLSKSWNRIADPTSKAHKKYGCKVEEVHSSRKCFAYLSKYIAKESAEVQDVYRGRRWGHSTNMDFSPLYDIDISHEVFVVVKRMVRKLLRKTGRVSVDFLLYLATDKTAFTYIKATTAIDMLNLAKEITSGKDPPTSVRASMSRYFQGMKS